MNTVIQTRVDSNTKKEAKCILSSMGFTIQEGIRIFLRQIVNTHSFPFKPALGNYPNAETRKVIAKTEAGIDCECYDSMDELIKKLK